MTPVAIERDDGDGREAGERCQLLGDADIAHPDRDGHSDNDGPAGEQGREEHEGE